MDCDGEQHSQCSALIISWKSCFVFFFMMDSQAPISAEPGETDALEEQQAAPITCPSSPSPATDSSTVQQPLPLRPMLRRSLQAPVCSPAAPAAAAKCPSLPAATPAPTQAQQTMLLLESLQFLGDKGLHLLDVHAAAALQETETRGGDWAMLGRHHRCPAPQGGTHVILRLQVTRLLAQEAEHAGEVLVPDLAEDLWGAQQCLATQTMLQPGTAGPQPQRDEVESPRGLSVTQILSGPTCCRDPAELRLQSTFLCTPTRSNLCSTALQHPAAPCVG